MSSTVLILQSVWHDVFRVLNPTSGSLWERRGCMLSLKPVLAQITTVYCTHTCSSTRSSLEILARCAIPGCRPMPDLISSTVGFIFFKSSIITTGHLQHELYWNTRIVRTKHRGHDTQYISGWSCQLVYSRITLPGAGCCSQYIWCHVIHHISGWSSYYSQGDGTQYISDRLYQLVYPGSRDPAQFRLGWCELRTRPSNSISAMFQYRLKRGGVLDCQMHMSSMVLFLQPVWPDIL